MSCDFLLVDIALCRVTCFTWNANPTRQPVGERQYTSTPIAYTSTIRPCFTWNHSRIARPPNLRFTWNITPRFTTPTATRRVSRETWEPSSNIEEHNPDFPRLPSHSTNSLGNRGARNWMADLKPIQRLFVCAPLIPRNKPYGFQRICGIRANAFYKA